MATTTFNAIQFLHVVGASVVVGYLAVIPMWRTAVAKSTEPSALRAFLDTLQRVQMRVVVPALGLLLLTGLLMTIGPFAEHYDLLAERWAQAGVVMALVLGYLIVSGLGGPAKKMLDLAEKNETTGPAMDKLMGEWRTALIAAAILSLAATGFMVFGARA